MVTRKYRTTVFTSIHFALMQAKWYLLFMYYRYLRHKTITGSEVIANFDSLFSEMPDNFIAGIFGCHDLDLAARKFMTQYSKSFYNFYQRELDPAEFTAAVKFYADFLRNAEFKQKLTAESLRLMQERELSKIDMYFCITSYVNDDCKTALGLMGDALGNVSKNMGYPAESALIEFWVNRHPEYRGLELLTSNYSYDHKGDMLFAAQLWKLDLSIGQAKEMAEAFLSDHAVPEDKKPALFAVSLSNAKSLFSDNLMLKMTEIMIVGAKLNDCQLASFYRHGNANAVSSEQRQLMNAILHRFLDGNIGRKQTEDCYNHFVKAAMEMLCNK